MELTRDPSTLKWTLKTVDGLNLEFSAATTDTDRYARLEAVNDISGNRITLTYDGEVGTGKLTKVSSPQGDARHLKFTYTSGLITKVELMENTTSELDYEYTYTSGELTTVTDHNGKTVDYAYASDTNATGSRYIDNITDKRGNVFDTAWTFEEVSTGVYEAKKIETLDPIGLTNVYDRSTTSDVCTITNYDNTTAMRKIVNTPITGDTSKTRYLDYYVGATGYQYERWESVYTDNDLTSTKAPGGTTYTSATYNSLGRMTASSVGSGSSATYSYPTGGLYATSITTPGGKTTNIEYDTSGRIETVSPPYVADSSTQEDYTVAYDSYGQVTSRTVVTNLANSQTVYTYNSTTGLLSQVTYYTGSTGYSANYYYDDAARVVKLTDWIDNVDGIRYAYDALGRLSTVTDYDDSTLTYTYDDVGNIASMTDYHNNTINYTYTARDQLYTLTAPGSKVWTYTYNALGQPTQVDIPNGMHTAYTYDTRNRLTEIAHKDGTTVKQSFGYTLDDDGTITKITHEDGSYWDYLYDGRNRLTSADRKSSSGNVVAAYDYTYDDADNMLTKTEPFEDDFEDGAYTGWK